MPLCRDQSDLVPISQDHSPHLFPVHSVSPDWLLVKLLLLPLAPEPEPPLLLKLRPPPELLPLLDSEPPDGEPEPDYGELGPWLLPLHLLEVLSQLKQLPLVLDSLEV